MSTGRTTNVTTNRPRARDLCTTCTWCNHSGHGQTCPDHIVLRQARRDRPAMTAPCPCARGVLLVVESSTVGNEDGPLVGGPDAGPGVR